MPTDDTIFLSKQTDDSANPSVKHAPPDSQFGGITIRAWLALMVIGTICAIQVAFAVRAMVVKDYNYSVDGQFWMIVSSVVVYYYAQDKKPQPANTTTITSTQDTPKPKDI